MKNADVEVSIDGSSAVPARTNASGAISLYTSQGFSGGNVAIYYRSYFVSDHIYEYPYIDDLIYITIGILVYAAAKKLADHGALHRKISISYGSTQPACPKASISTESLQRCITDAAAERPDAIRYDGIVADLGDVCVKAAPLMGVGLQHAAALSDEIEAEIHALKDKLCVSVINGIVYGSTSALEDVCAMSIYEDALYSGIYSIPRGATSSSIIKANSVGTCNSSNIGALALRLMKSHSAMRIIIAGKKARASMLYRACMPYKLESAFLFMYLSKVAGAIYV
ncbi:MAG: hypothetical protein QXW10_01735 [Candidatus Micrarchaeaceae archaeon]